MVMPYRSCALRQWDFIDPSSSMAIPPTAHSTARKREAEALGDLIVARGSLATTKNGGAVHASDPVVHHTDI